MKSNSVLLSEIGEFKNGLNFNKHDYGKGFPLINVKQLFQSRFATVENLLEIKRDFAKKIDGYFVKKGDLLFVRGSMVLKGAGKLAMVNQFDENTVFSGFIIRFRLSNVDITTPLFLTYILGSPKYREMFVRIASGSVHSNMNQEILGNIKIELPDIIIQNKIVKILDDLDSKIESLQNQNKYLTYIVNTIFKSWFVNFDGVTVWDDSELGKIPKGWQVVKFNEFASCVKGFSYKGVEKFNSPQGFEFVTLNSIKEGGGFKKKITWIESNRFKERHFVNEMDLIIANTEQTKDARLLSTPAFVQFSYDYDKNSAVYSHHISKIEPKIKNSKFYLYSFFLYYQQNIANAYHTGTGVWGFDHNAFEKDYSILKPSSKKLEQFEIIVFEFHAKIIEHEKSISLLTDIRDQLLPKLMSGKIRV